MINALGAAGAIVAAVVVFSSNVALSSPTPTLRGGTMSPPSAPTQAPGPVPSPTATPSPVVTPSPVSSFLAPGSVPNANRWQNITPGTPIERVRGARGTSLLERVLPDGSLIDWYAGPSDNAYIIVASRNGTIIYVRVFPVDASGSLTGLTDPYGVTPGDDAVKLRTRRGNPQEGRKLSDTTTVLLYPGGGDLLWLYEFTSGSIHAISLYSRKAALGPAVPLSANGPPHDGTTISRAYVIHAANEETGVRFERYYATHRGGCLRWLITNQTLLSTGGRKIDQLDLECADDKTQMSMFFDVTSFFGKL